LIEGKRKQGKKRFSPEVTLIIIACFLVSYDLFQYLSASKNLFFFLFDHWFYLVNNIINLPARRSKIATNIRTGQEGQCGAMMDDLIVQFVSRTGTH